MRAASASAASMSPANLARRLLATEDAPKSACNRRLSSGTSGCVTITCGTNARAASTTSRRFSSTLTTRCVGARARSRARSGSLVPPIFGTRRASRGWTQKPVRATT